jgi:hypothetical protein
VRIIMGVRIDIGLDFEGNHTFAYETCDDPRALDVPESVLRRWAAERAAFARARARWQAVVAEIDKYLLHGERQGEGDAFAAETRAFDASPLDVAEASTKPAEQRRAKRSRGSKGVAVS